MKKYAVIVAGGAGSRMGTADPILEPVPPATMTAYFFMTASYL